MDMAELKAIVQDITRQAGAPKHSDTPRGGDLFIFPSNLTQQQAFLQLSSAANTSLSASLPKSSTGKKASSTTCLSQNQKRILSTPSSFKAQQKSINSTGPSMAQQQYQQEPFASHSTDHFPPGSPL